MAYKRRFKKNKTEDKSSGKIKHTKTTIDEIKFDSKMESDYYKLLKIQKEEGLIQDFELQPEFILQNKYIIVDNVVIEGNHPDFDKIKRKSKAPTIQAIKYIGDFKIIHNDGKVEIVDTKGIETTDFKIKKKMFMMKYPYLKFSVIIKTKGNEWIPYDTYMKQKREQKKLRLKK